MQKERGEAGRRPAVMEPAWQECIELLDRLPGLPREARLDAIEQLVRSSSPAIRGRALRMGAALLSDDTLTAYLRDDNDDVLRNAGLEMLKMRGHRGFSLAVHLLRDADPDVSLQAVLVLDHLKDPRALEPLRLQLRHPDPNVVQATIVAIGHMGDARSIPELLPFLAADAWLQLAAVEALGDLRSTAAVGPLAALLTDLMVGPFAAEALARIGGGRAFRSLAEHWLRFQAEVDPESLLGLLAHVLEGLRRPPAPVEGLREALSEALVEGAPGVKAAASRCLLGLGPGPTDDAALEMLVERQREARLLPACLAARPDLTATLLAADDHRRAWGLLLAAKFAAEVPLQELVACLGRPLDPDWLDLVVEALVKLKGREVASALLALYASLPVVDRPLLAPALVAHRRETKRLVDERQDLPSGLRLVLGARLGESPRTVAKRIDELPVAARVEVLAQLSDVAELMRILPWQEWLEEDPEHYGPVAVEAAVDVGLRELVPSLRRLLETSPTPELIRALGEMGDRESVPALVRMLETHAVSYAPVILETLGHIGGPEVRKELRQAAGAADADQARIAYRALSLCATEEDDAFFRAAASHQDWYVRLAAAEVLGRFQRPDNLAALAQLAADPSAIVAQRALAILEPEAAPK